ncbi:glycosyltransferase [Thiocystis violacea]|uniref:glycosyltransferase n=1 Tax=Thiocystis violacea TaxID=13725 RepID=UPI001A928277|nr:glycosyltransferase [Thiocystis violacea]
MSVHNGERFLREAVNSILNQTFTDFEFLIFDDCSTDSTLKILQSYDDPRIQIIINEENIGLTESLNKGLALARSDLIARMDADDISLPNRFEKQVNFLQDKPQIAAVGTWKELIDESGYCFFQEKLPTDPEKIHYALLIGNCFAHPSMMFRHDAVIKVGGYQNRAGKYAQDYDLWLRLSHYYSLANLPEFLVQYRVHSDQVSTKKLRMQTKMALYYRKIAAEERLKNGETLDRIMIEGPNWFERRSAVPGTLGQYFFYTALTYQRMGEKRRASMIFLSALIESPFSFNLWAFLLDETIFSKLSFEQRKALRWYVHRIARLFWRV